jgi:hypothetical protein
MKDRQCSKHFHRHKYNLFFVVSGKLKIVTWKNDYDLVDETILGPYERTIIKPGEYHRFIALEDSYVIEKYWVQLSLSDIEREDCGGLLKQAVTNDLTQQVIARTQKKPQFPIGTEDGEPPYKR